MDALQTFEASLRHAVRERQAATVGGGHFTHQELEEVLSEIMALRAEVAALSANAHDDYRAIERKDALLRQALEAITHGCPPGCNDGMTDSGGTYPWGEAVLMPCPACETAKSITKELSQ